MSEPKKIGDGMAASMAKLGLEELRNANIPQAPAEAPPVAEAPTYDPGNAVSRGPTKERGGMSR